MNTNQDQARDLNLRPLDPNLPLTTAELNKMAEENVEVKRLLTDSPQETLKVVSLVAESIVNRTVKPDRWIYRIIVSGLVLIALAFVIGGILPQTETKLPPETIAIGCAAVGCLIGLLFPSPIGTSAWAGAKVYIRLPWILIVVLAIFLASILIFFWLLHPDNKLHVGLLAAASLTAGLLVGIIAPAPK